MQDSIPSPTLTGLSFQDILIAFFKHKWKIFICALLGIAAAVPVLLIEKPAYESQAKLLVRYVVDRSVVDPVESGAAGSRGAEFSDTHINSEVEILTSWDLAMEVVGLIDPARLLAASGEASSSAAATEIIRKGLDVKATKGSNVIFVSYESSDPQLATLVLNKLIEVYFKKHLDVHRSAQALAFVTQQRDLVKGKLTQTENELKRLRGEAKIVNLADGTASLNSEMVRTQERLLAAHAELAQQHALVTAMEKASGIERTTGENTQAAANVTGGLDAAKPVTNPPVNNSPAGGPSTALTPPPTFPPPPAAANPDLANNTASGGSAVATSEEQIDIRPLARSEDVQQFQAFVTRLAQLRQIELDLLSKYTLENQHVKHTQSQIRMVEVKLRALEEKFPDLAAKVPTTPAPQGRQFDLHLEQARLAGLQARAEALKVQLANLQIRIQQFGEVAPQIAQLERQKELEEANYKYFGSSLEKARIDEALDPSKMPNISMVQTPSPALRVTSIRNKLALGLAGGGLGLGLALALFLELVLNRGVKRPLELENKLRIPLLLSIPFIAKKERLRLRGSNAAGDSSSASETAVMQMSPWERGHFLRRYFEALRDRLSLYFEISEIRHKPKLVGVTGFAEGAGASTLAGGLAASLSETGDGKVLLVDMNAGNGKMHPFFKGTPAYSLTAALHAPESMDSASENLFLATVTSANERPVPIGLRKFFELIPGLKASDFDYIIFDLPPVEQTSPTMAIASCMDQLLLVVEAEKTDRDVVRRGYQHLVAGRSKVSVVFNKAHSYAPKWLEGEVV